MPGIASLASALSSRLPDKAKKAYLIELDETDSPCAAFAFQYFPESISDSKNINYQQKEIPGGSLPLYQWVASGERLITFTAVFTSDVDLLPPRRPGQSSAEASSGLVSRVKAAGVNSRNTDIRAAVAWLRRYTLPTYARNITYSPSKLRLSLPGSGIGVAGGAIAGSVLDDTVICVMTQCDVTYEAFFPSGLPRYVTVNVSFAQIPQMNGQVLFPARNDLYDNYVTATGGSTSLGYDFAAEGSDAGLTWKASK